VLSNVIDDVPSELGNIILICSYCGAFLVVLLSSVSWQTWTFGSSGVSKRHHLPTTFTSKTFQVVYGVVAESTGQLPPLLNFSFSEKFLVQKLLPKV